MSAHRSLSGGIEPSQVRWASARQVALAATLSALLCFIVALATQSFGLVSWPVATAVVAISGAASFASHVRGKSIARLVAFSQTDSLTAVGNRHALLARLEQEVARCNRNARPLSLLMIDVDRLKEVNDRLGHPAGDALLKAVAGAIKNSVRISDAVGRFGGDEFLVIAPETAEQAGRALGNRIARQVERIEAPVALAYTPSVSIGVASTDGVLPDPALLIEAADRDMYSAKGRFRRRPRAQRAHPASDDSLSLGPGAGDGIAPRHHSP